MNRLVNSLPNNWPLTRFGDVVRNVNDNVRDPLTSDLERYVGLDHLDPESLHIKRWGVIADGTTFTRKFVAGQVLFGKRRAYQRKVAVAEFDGICSGDILVFEPANDQLLPELLPFIVQSDGFFEHALGTSAGSLSPRTKWQDLARYEFALPPLDEQRRVAEILWAADETIIRWESVVQDLHRAVEVSRRSFFQDSHNGNVKKLGDLFEVQLGKMLSPAARRGVSPKPYLGNSNVQWGRFDLSEIKTMDFDDEEFEKFRLRPGDLLACEGGEVGRTAIWRDDIEDCCYQKALHRLRPLTGEVLPEVMLQFMFYAAGSGYFTQLTGHSTIAHLTAVKLRTLQVPVLPLDTQDKMIEVFAGFASSIQNAEKHLSNSKQLKKEMLNHLLKANTSERLET